MITPLSLILGFTISRYKLEKIPTVSVAKSKKKKAFKRDAFLNKMQSIMQTRKNAFMMRVVSWLKKFNLEFSPSEMPVKITVFRIISMRSPITT